MVNDTISDFLIRIKNAYLAHHKSLTLPYGRNVEAIGKILVKEGFIEDTKATIEENKRKVITITLKYKNRKPALTDLKRVSKPGLRIYVSKNHIPRVYGGLGIVILSTSSGVMSSRDAKKKNIGGELLCKIW